MVAENDVDLETLQAQIDMSMSFAHNLVTSWIKPTQLAQLRYNGTNATQILEEELRRPPRLGVGAPIPAMVSEAGEASKLKHRLVKSGRKNENGGPGETKTQGPSKSDDEEHKGRTTKRKTKVDPFALEGSKKRRKVNSILVSLPLEIGQQGAVECAAPTDEAPFSQNEILGEHFDHKLSPRKTKQRSDQELLGCLRQGSVPLTSPRPVTLPPRVQSSLSPSRTAPTLGSPAELSRKSALPVPGNIATSQTDRIHSNDPSLPMPDRAKEPPFPLLNLDGPPELFDKLGNPSDPNSSRKKRKRRKKKKAQTSTGTGDNSLIPFHSHVATRVPGVPTQLCAFAQD